MAFTKLSKSDSIPLYPPATPVTLTAHLALIPPLTPQDTPPPSIKITMDPTDLNINLAEMFNAHMSMAPTAEVLDLPANDEEAPDPVPLTLLVKPFGFRIPPPKLIIPRLIQIWAAKKGVSIIPDDRDKEILVCLFRDQRDLIAVEKGGAYHVQGAHMMLKRWDRALPFEEIKFNTVSFWIQLRGIPPELLSHQNITQLAKQAGSVVQVDWKNKGSVPKWFVTPRALVKVPTTKPMCPGYLIARGNNSASWVYFKYEKLATFCYDCGTLGHEQGNCSSYQPIIPDKYGPWLRHDPKNDLPPPQVSAVPDSPPPNTPSGVTETEPNCSPHTPYLSPKPLTHRGDTAPKKPKFKIIFNIPDNLAALAPDFDVQSDTEDGAIAQTPSQSPLPSVYDGEQRNPSELCPRSLLEGEAQKDGPEEEAQGSPSQLGRAWDFTDQQSSPMDSLYLGITSSQAHDYSPKGPIYPAHYSPDFSSPSANAFFYNPLARKRKIEFPTIEPVKRAAPYTAPPIEWQYPHGSSPICSITLRRWKMVTPPMTSKWLRRRAQACPQLIHEYPRLELSRNGKRPDSSRFETPPK
ncbi:hypothetical protein CRG98_032545 [Punica granatum]|uniref:CCHC-type domain-containing protein n=1 Tax=Punica granatum TaxID=22663 RepID=A0A2I0ISU4_PUNGR|nr:hypothetical protein CRG98_032545 [Punica granatum]